MVGDKSPSKTADWTAMWARPAWISVSQEVTDRAELNVAKYGNEDAHFQSTTFDGRLLALGGQ